MFASGSQPRHGYAVLKLIAAFGVLACGVLLLSPWAINWALAPDAAQIVNAAPSRLSPFDGQRAYATLKQIVAFGSRHSGSQGFEAQRALLKRELHQLGFKYEEQSFQASTPLGQIPMVNLVAYVEGSIPGAIILGNHYDTKYFPKFEFLGANDGGSTTAWMLEFARTVGPKRQGRSLWLCWFDGEEALVEWSDADSLYGSRAFVQGLRTGGLLREIHVMINVDMIGDCFLGVQRDTGAPPWLSRPVWQTAGRLGYGPHFLATGQRIEDDHIPFRNAGIPALELIDFSYGGSIADHHRNWHTPNDVISRVCPESLQAIGDVIYHALPEIEAALDANRRGQNERNG